MSRALPWMRRVAEGARLMVGIPDYEVYVQHMQLHHPERAPMSYEEFFRNRQEARYGGKGKGGFRCC